MLTIQVEMADNTEPSWGDQLQPAGENEDGNSGDIQEAESVDNDKPGTGRTKLGDRVIMVIRGHHEEDDIVIVSI